MPETKSQPNLTVAESDFPALYLAADSASRLAQKQHLLFTATILAATGFKRGARNVGGNFSFHWQVAGSGERGRCGRQFHSDLDPQGDEARKTVV